MVRKTSLLLPCLAIAVVLFSTACGGAAQYSQMADVIRQTVQAQRQFCRTAHTVAGASQAASAMDQCADQLRAVQAQWQAIIRAYPELRTMTEAPPELRSLLQEAEVTGREMMDCLQEIAELYADDPAVQLAWEKLTNPPAPDQLTASR